MANLLIRNLPPDLHARLKASAAAHRRSLTQEAILVVEGPTFPESDWNMLHDGFDPLK